MSDSERKHMSKAGEFRRLEIFTGAVRRRQWPPELKAQIVAESYVPGVTVSEVARRHGLRVQQLFTWRHAAKQSRKTQLGFVPVVVPAKDAPMRMAGTTGLEIVVELGGGRVRVPAGADATTLRAVLWTLRELA